VTLFDSAEEAKGRPMGLVALGTARTEIRRRARGKLARALFGVAAGVPAAVVNAFVEGKRTSEDDERKLVAEVMRRMRADLAEMAHHNRSGERR
jgi:glutathione S-transferase